MKRKLHHKIYFWHKITDNALLAILVSGLFTLIFGGMGHVYLKLQNELSQLEVDVRQLAGADEDMYIYCNTFVKNPNKPTEFERNQIFSLHQENEKKLETLISQIYVVEKFISPKTYIAVTNLNCWNNILFEAGEKVCSLKLKKPQNIDNWRNEIIAQIETEKSKHQEFLSIIQDSFSSIKILFKEEPWQVNKGECEYDKISKY